MKTGIFADIAAKYIESGISVIPVQGKKAFLGGWSKYCSIVANESELEKWCEWYGSENIGVCCGPASDLVAVDIDSDDSDLISAIVAALPRTPCAKLGKKGITLFFRGNVQSRNIRNDGRSVVDILCDGRQTVIPPSVHPDTGEPYQWVYGRDLIDSLDDLPRIDESDIGKIEHAVLDFMRGSKLGNIGRAAADETGGRNNRLVQVCSAKIFERKPIGVVVRDLIEFDRKEHGDNALFSDSSENHGSVDVEINAMRFYVSVFRSLRKSGKAESPFDEGEYLNGAFIETNDKNGCGIDPDLIAEATAEIIDGYPMPSGVMETMVKYCMATSPYPNQTLAISSAVVTMGALCCNHVTSGGQWPAMYCMSIAPSGFGKDRPIKTASELIGLIEPGLLGAGSYGSDSAILKEFSDNTNVRMMVMDEVGGFLKLASDMRGASYQHRISDVLASLWSSSASRYEGKTTLAAGKVMGQCWHPCPNILATTTPAGFREGASKESFEKGFQSRFLNFITYQQGRRNDDAHEALALAQKVIIPGLIERLKFIVGLGGEMGNLGRKKPLEIKQSDKFKEKYKSLRDDLDKVVREHDDESVMKPIAIRLAEQIGRLSIIHCASRMAQEGRILELDEQDMDWAVGIVTAHKMNSARFLRDNVSDDQASAKILRAIKGRGAKGIGHTELWNAVGRPKLDMFKKSLQLFVENDIIASMKEKSVKSKKPTVRYVALKSGDSSFVNGSADKINKFD